MQNQKWYTLILQKLARLKKKPKEKLSSVFNVAILEASLYSYRDMYNSR